MQINPQTSVPQPDIQIFQSMKANIDITTILPNATTLEYYYYIKAYKLVDCKAFYSYCKLHKGTNLSKSHPNATKFLLMLYAILDENYPPLEYGHNQQDGYIGLDDYVELAKGVFL